MFELFKDVLSVVGIFFTLYGFSFFVKAVFIKGKGKIDKSNVWNRLIAPWYVASHPEVFGNIKFFQNDIGENIKLVEEAMLNREKK